MWLTSSLPSSTACTLDLRSSSSSSSPSSFVDVPSASVPSVLWFDLIRRAPFVTQFGGLVGQRLRARERASTAMSPNIRHVHRHRSRCRRPCPLSTTPRPSLCYDSCCQLILKGVLLHAECSNINIRIWPIFHLINFISFILHQFIFRSNGISFHPIKSVKFSGITVCNLDYYVRDWTSF